MMIIDNEFDIGQVVYLKTDSDQNRRIVLFIYMYSKGELMYRVASGTMESSHYGFELTSEKDVITATTN